MLSSKICRGLAFSLTALLSGMVGWWLHGPAQSQTRAESDSILQARSSSASRDLRFNTNAESKTQRARNGSPEGSRETSDATETRIAETMERVFYTDSDDLVEMMEGFGSLTRMTDDEVRVAWGQLARRVPSNNFGGGLTVMYLWSRMWQMGEKVDLPIGWGVQDFEVALASEKARHDGEESAGEMHRRLESGDSLSDTERRVLFGQAVRTDPLEAVKLWCRVTRPEDFQRDAQWFYTALTEPAQRDAIMTELRKWQKGENLAEVVTSVARNWIDRDPEAVERWLQQPAQSDIKDAVMKEIINTRASANPVDAWEWSRSLTDEDRRLALGISAAKFASVGPVEAEMGMKFIAGLQNPDDRLEAISKFAGVLAGNDLDRWKQWRDTLSTAEQNRANETAFDYWAANDTSAAVEWLSNRPVGDAKNRMVSKLANLYARNDPQTAVQLIRSIPDADRRREAVTVALTTVGPDDLNLVRTLLSGLSEN